MNKVCFGNRNGQCKILNVKKCTGEECVFHKTLEEHKLSLQWSNNRIAFLDKVAQKHIADTYYKGEYPWIKGGEGNGC